jgi:ubiquinone/menaquinone biosynthesis C-methylase UbiE
MARTQIFVSYSHKDKPWLERLQVHLRPLERFGLLQWDDTRIRPGDRWLDEIQSAIAKAKVVILLVSADFLASDFIARKELPELLKKAEKQGATILPVIIGACLFDETKSISAFQAVNSPISPLEALSPGDQNRVWVDLARRVQEILEAPEPAEKPAPTETPSQASLPSALTAAPALGNRHALIIEVPKYTDPFFDALWGDSTGTTGLIEVLADPKIGGFTVTNLTNETNETAEKALRDFFIARRPEDHVLVYFSGMAIKDAEFGLHFATADSRRDELETTIPGHLVQRFMRRSAAQLQLVIFDCRYAGAFPHGKIDSNTRVGPIAGLQGEGRFVFSTTNLLSWAWEKDGTGEPRKLRDVESSLLADLTHGLKTGKADLDKNLAITVGELFEFVAAAAGARKPDADPEERPCRWAFDQSKGDSFVVAQAKLSGEEQPPTPRRKRFSVSQDIRRPILDLIAPTYLLDDRYYMLDWNPAFDEVIAKPLKLVRGPTHAGVFVRELENSEEVVKHANETFASDVQPLVDTEELVFNSSKYGGIFGRIHFQKIAAQITRSDGSTAGWSVSLNVKEVEREEATFWNTILKRIQDEVGWSRYAVVYDNLLLEFDEYRKLITLVANQVGSAARCIDLGAGTGNTTLYLLQSDPEREVWYVEINETMLRHFRAKLRHQSLDFGDRLTIIKDNIIRLDGFPPSSFDAAVMTNVLYAIDDREECLRNINRILRTGGILSISTSYRETDVDRLFDALQDSLANKGLLDQYQEQVDVARARHTEMEAMIRRDTIDDTKRLLKDAGFTIEGDARKEYVDAVIVLKAVKTGEPIPKSSSVVTSELGKGTSGPARPKPPDRGVRDVFLSYCADDKPVADAILAALERQSIGCWIAPRDIQPSSDWTDAIIDAIQNCRVMLLVLSRHASTSETVKREVSFAADKGIPIIPFRVDDTEPSNKLAFFLNNVHWLDAFPPPLEAHFPRLIDSIKFLLATAAGAESSA